MLTSFDVIESDNFCRRLRLKVNTFVNDNWVAYYKSFSGIFNITQSWRLLPDLQSKIINSYNV
jgi:hypothetical protein